VLSQLKNDDLAQWKTYTLNALSKQGMTEKTTVTAPRWCLKLLVVILSLQPHCQQLLCILDWFHIAMRFENVAVLFWWSLYRDLWVKWTLWHGKPDETLSKLKILMTNVADENAQNSKSYMTIWKTTRPISKYEEREQQNKTYTSQVAEFTLNLLSTTDTKTQRKCNGLGRSP